MASDDRTLVMACLGREEDSKLRRKLWKNHGPRVVLVLPCFACLNAEGERSGQEVPWQVLILASVVTYNCVVL